MEDKIIPTLTGEVAERFEANAMDAERNARTIDFTENVELERKIIKKHLEV